MISIHFHTVTPKLMIKGPEMAFSGTTVHINCTQLEGRPHDLYITTPQGTVIPDSTAIFNATNDHTGNFTCTANISQITITESHYLFVYGKFPLYVTGSGKTGRNCTFINIRNTNYKYLIQYITGTNLAASTQLSMDLQLFMVFHFINYSMDS